MTATFRTVAVALVEYLPTVMPYLTTCRLYAGEIEDIGNGGQPFDPAPAAYVISDTLEPVSEDEGFGEYLYRARYGLVLVARSLGVRLDAQESGDFSAHRMIEDVQEFVPDATLDLVGFSGLTLGVIRRVKITSSAAVYVVELSALVTIAK